MEEQHHWRVAIILAVVVLALACCRKAAYGEERVLPPGTTIQLPREGDRIVLEEAQFLVERSSIDKANAVFEMERRLTRQLVECSTALDEKRTEPSWKVAIRWTSIGIAIGAAFGLGLYLG